VKEDEGFDLYREGRDKGYFCQREKGGDYIGHVWPGRSAFPDFSEPEVRDWWGDAHKALTDQGIDGIWNDMNEPSIWYHGVKFKDMVLPVNPIRNPKMVHKDEGRDTPHISFRNLYGMMECKATQEGLLRHRPGVRPFVLTRSGYAGIQRHAAVWTGDNFSRYSHLALTIPMLLNLGLSGIGFAGPDIGGFMLNCSAELYARWIELGSFYPFCRSHTMVRSRRQEPWSFGDRVTRIARQYIKLRYQLHPTMYSLFREMHDTGAPILRPLFHEFQDDRAADEIEDQLMFGPSLLLAPVLEKGVRRRDVYLPEARWTDYWTGEVVDGPVVVSRAAPLEVMPIYVKDGAVLFKWPALSWLDQRPVDRLFIELYPPRRGESSSALYEDDGISDEYERGVFSRRRVVQERDGDKITARIMPHEGPFKPPDRELVIKLRLDGPPGKVTLDGKILSVGDSGARYSPAGRVLRVGLADDWGGHELTVES